MSRPKLYTEQELYNLILDFTNQTSLPLTWHNVIEWSKTIYPGQYENLRDYHFSRFPSLRQYLKNNKSLRLKCATETESSEPTTQDFTLSITDFQGKSEAELANMLESKNKTIMQIVKGARGKEAIIMKLRAENKEFHTENNMLKDQCAQLKKENTEKGKQINTLKSSVHKLLKANREIANSSNLCHLEETGIIESSSTEHAQEITAPIIYSAIEAEIIQQLEGTEPID